MKPGQKLTFSGGVYRLAPGAAAPVRPKPQAQSNGLPVYAPPDRTAVMGEANTTAQSIYQPLLDQIRQRYERQRQESIARQQATQAATQQAYAQARDPMANLWNSAIGQATTLENAVSNRLKGVGDSRGTDFAAKLAQIGAPETGAAQELATTYQGADAANFASGMSDVGRLVSRGAEARSWLEKQPGLAAQQSQAELAQALNELAGLEMDESGEITANIPGQVQELFDRIYGQKEQAGKDVYEDKWTRIKHLDQQKKDAMEAKLVAREMGDKAAEAAANRELKRIDQEIKMRGQDITVRGQDLTAATSTANNIRTNTPKPGAKSKNDSVNTPGSAKQNRARQNAWSSVAAGGGGFNTDILRKLKQHPNSSDAIINTAINNSLRSTGVNPNSALGKALRKEVRTRLGGRMWKVESGPLAGTYRFKP